MEDKTTATVKKAASAATQITFSFITIAIVAAFLGGAVLGKAARYFYMTMFSPNVVVLPSNNK